MATEKERVRELKSWAKEQRRQYRLGTLAGWKIAELKKHNFDFGVATPANEEEEEDSLMSECKRIMGERHDRIREIHKPDHLVACVLAGFDERWYVLPFEVADQRLANVPDYPEFKRLALERECIPAVVMATDVSAGLTRYWFEGIDPQKGASVGITV